jgi:hypothetical protein
VAVEDLHRTLAYAVVAGVVLAVAWTAVALATGRGGGQRLESFQSAVFGVVALDAVIGLFLFLTDYASQDRLHVLHGFLALAALPFVRSFGTRMSAPGRLALSLDGVVALGLFVVRLFMTG